jgi:hypothetical protein
LASVSQTSPHSFSKDFPFEGREDGQKAGHGSTGWRGQVQGFVQGNETDSEMFRKRLAMAVWK